MDNLAKHMDFHAKMRRPSHTAHRERYRRHRLLVSMAVVACVAMMQIKVGAQGSSRAVLGLLEQLGFRWLQPVANGTNVPALKTVAIPDDLSFTHAPPFMYVAGRMYNWGDWSMANSFRKAVKVYSQGGHTWDVVDDIPAVEFSAQCSPLSNSPERTFYAAGKVGLLSDNLRGKYPCGKLQPNLNLNRLRL